MFNSNGLSASDVALLNDRNGNGFFGSDGWWVIIICALIFGWGGNGFGGFGGGNSRGVQDAYILNSDFSTLSRQIDNGFSEQRGQGIQLANGISSLGYEQLGQMNGINTNIMQSTNAIQSQLASCCCDNREAIAGVNYNLATQANGVTNAINSGFCQTNFNAQTNARDIIDSQSAGTQAILARIDALESSRKDEKIAELTAMNSDLRLQASQFAQNQYIHDLVKPPINPCYVTQNPYCSCGNAGFYGYGSTIA